MTYLYIKLTRVSVLRFPVNLIYPRMTLKKGGSIKPLHSWSWPVNISVRGYIDCLNEHRRAQPTEHGAISWTGGPVLHKKSSKGWVRWWGMQAASFHGLSFKGLHCLSFLPWLPSMMECDLEVWGKQTSFSPKLPLAREFYHKSIKETEAVTTAFKDKATPLCLRKY